MNLLIVEDDFYFRSFVAELLRPYASLYQADNFQMAKKILNEESIDFALFDINLHGDDCGLELVKLAESKNITSIVLTDYDQEELIEEAYNFGCRHYLTKDQCETEIVTLIKDFLSDGENFIVNKFLKENFITAEQSLIEEFKSLQKRMNGQRPILILGETGVGKGEIASLVHRLQGNKKDQLVSVNVSSIPENMIESEFFGHVRGAFTGAIDNRAGKMKLADQGTLFLDEMATMPLVMQKKLLKALEEKSFYPLGGSRPIKSSYQLVCATCDDIFKMIRDESFRLDLFQRINGISIVIPPLRERRGDIALLLNHFLKRGSRRIVIRAEAMSALKNYDWPGNVRELKNVVDNLVAKGKGIVNSLDLPRHIVRNENPFRKVLAGTHFLPENHVDYIKRFGLKKYVEKVEVEAFNKINHDCEGRGSKTQQLLKLSRSGAYRLSLKAKNEEFHYE